MMPGLGPWRFDMAPYMDERGPDLVSLGLEWHAKMLLRMEISGTLINVQYAHGQPPQPARALQRSPTTTLTACACACARRPTIRTRNGSPRSARRPRSCPGGCLCDARRRSCALLCALLRARPQNFRQRVCLHFKTIVVTPRHGACLYDACLPPTGRVSLRANQRPWSHCPACPLAAAGTMR